MNNSLFRCEMCGGVFEKLRSDEDAIKEAKEKFDMDPEIDEMAMVCEDCYLELFPEETE